MKRGEEWSESSPGTTWLYQMLWNKFSPGNIWLHQMLRVKFSPGTIWSHQELWNNSVRELFDRTVQTLHTVFNEQRKLKLEGRQAPLENWIHGQSQPSSKFKLHVSARCIYVTSLLAPCPDTCLESSMSESGYENSATYRRWQSTSINNRRRYFTTQIRNRIFPARNKVVLKSAGSEGVCAVSHFILVYTTVLTSWWVSEDMPLPVPTARHPVQNIPTRRC
jgi:hypothetical protein